MTLQVVRLSAALVGAATLLLMTQVFVARALLLWRTRRDARVVLLWEPVLIGAIDGRPSELPRLPRRDVFAFLKLWNHLQDSVVDEPKAHLNDVARHAGVPAIAHRMLRHGNLRNRLIAIATLGHLQDRSVWTGLCALTRSPQVVVSLAAARALVQIDPQAAIAHLMPLITTRTDWPAARVANLLLAAGSDAVSAPLAAAALAASPRHAPRLIRYLDVVHCQTAAPVVRQIIQGADDVEVIAACLRVFQDAEDLDTVRRFLEHERWEVRVQAAVALGRMGTTADVTRLSRRLEDAEWWVRYRSAHAICALLADDTGALDRLQAGHRNPFARDALAQARAERLLR